VELNGQDVNTGPARTGRIPSLDGLRAVAIGLVLFAHLGGTRGFPLTGDTTEFFKTGILGVHIFFVLSGFLITGLLLTEIERMGTVSLAAFYLRRTFRIFPAYFTYLGVVALTVAVGWTTLRPGDLLYAITFTENYHPDRAWLLGHAWSLSVEEQFYVMWPFLLRGLGVRRGLWAALVFACVAPFIRLAEWYGPGVFHMGVGYTFETVADAIALGCLLAGYRERLWTMRWYRAIMTPRGIAAIAAIVLLVAAQERPRLQSLVGVTVMNLGIAAIVDYFVRVPTGVVGRLLNTPSVRHMGVMSYSIYLWQQPFLNASVRAGYTTFPLSVALIGLCAAVSYYAIEAPFLAARQRIQKRRRRALQQAV
jgi:peptidoglycan/LPS O-acetylase OafA/YrhL